MEHSATDNEDMLVFDVKFSGLTDEDYRYLISLAKSMKARSEAARTYAGMRRDS